MPIWSVLELLGFHTLAVSWSRLLPVCSLTEAWKVSNQVLILLADLILLEGYQSVVSVDSKVMELVNDVVVNCFEEEGHS